MIFVKEQSNQTKMMSRIKLEEGRNVEVMEKNNVICFYHENEVFGCFSNWYPSVFEYAGRTYKSVEQYMMYQKAILFREFEIADEIMNSDDPAHIKKLGRSKMERFDSNLWDKVSYTIVKRGIDAKFTQNPELCSKLIKTGNKLLAEASRNDLKWGIGIDIEDIRCYDTKFWMGKNLLGRALMEVRDELVLADRHSLEYVDAKEIDF